MNTQQAEGLLLKSAIAKYVEQRMPTTHMRGFFNRQSYDSTTISLEVMRDNDFAAVDVLRGTNGNLNEATKWSAKEIIPPFYHEKFNVNGLRFYERAMGMNAATATTSNRAALANEVATMLVKLQNKIVRAEEIQCTQVLELGTVTLLNGDTIDFGRKADSLKDNSATPWTNENCDVESQLQAGIEFIANVGANTAGIFDLTMSGQAWISLQKTKWFKDRANYTQVSLISIGSPQNRNGATFMGQIQAGAGIFNVWVYDATVLDITGARVRLTDQTKVIMTPVSGAQFELSYGAVDQIVKSTGASSLSGLQLQKGAADYYVWDNIDANNLVHTMHMTSAPIARLITVDMVYTMKIATSFTTPNQS